MCDFFSVKSNFLVIEIYVHSVQFDFRPKDPLQEILQGLVCTATKVLMLSHFHKSSCLHRINCTKVPKYIKLGTDQFSRYFVFL
jgi:hypothetical protein